MKRTQRILYRLIVGALLVNILWWMLSLLLQSDTLPTPIRVYTSLSEVVAQGMDMHLWASLIRLGVGVPIAVLMGVLVAWCMYRSAWIRRVLGAFIYLCYPIPKLALLPVVMLLAGLGDVGKGTMIVLILIFQIIINVRDSLRNIPQESFLVATSMGARQPYILRHIILPAVLPDILSTLRVAIGTAISVLFVTETYGTDRGMGYFIIDSWMRLNYIDMYAGIVLLSMVGFALFILTDLAEALLCRWRDNH